MPATGQQFFDCALLRLALECDQNDTHAFLLGSLVPRCGAQASEPATRLSPAAEPSWVLVFKLIRIGDDPPQTHGSRSMQGPNRRSLPAAGSNNCDAPTRAA